jgi:predicted acyl esterase
MRTMLVVAALAAGLIVAPAADAAIPAVFSGTATPVSCVVQTAAATAGQRFCGTGAATIPSWDGAPIDVSVAFPPAPASGPDGPYTVIGLYHGWGGSKLGLGGVDAQRALTRGYAVFTMTDRGWGRSCGTAPRAAECTGKGYIHLMHDAYEVRDAQYALGQLADDGVIDPQRIGAIGGSYGGAMAIALGALRNRTQLPNGTLIPWTSPLGKPLQIAATAPEFTWSDLDTALMPNGSSLDYVSNGSYRGPQGDHRIGVQKQSWNANLYLAGQFLGFYAPVGTDSAADITGWKSITDSGGPFDGSVAAQAMTDELAANHSALYIDDSIPPAPALLANGWNDDLFPVDEAIRYYNKVRARWPAAPITMFHLDFGHSPRAAATVSVPDRAALTAAENAWFDYYLKGAGPEPADARGGVDILTSKCPVSAAGTRYHAPSWPQLAPGEIRLDTTGTQTVAAPGTAPSNPFTSGDVCTSTASADNASAATYKLPAATTAFTLAGSPTIVAKLTTTGANDALYARLYDVDGATQRLIARGVQRPLGVGAGPTEQVFQLHPQAWTVQPGHVLKLELLAQDSPYLRTASATAPQQSVSVSDLQLRLPVVDAPGADLGNGVKVATPAPKYVPAGYRLAPGWAAYADGGAGGTVPATLALTLGPAASLGAFQPGLAHDYTTETTAKVTSTAGDALLSVSDPGRLRNGAFSLPQPLQVTGVPKTYAGPVSNDVVTIGFKQPIGATDALRTGSYATTLTFTLSTTTP